MRKFGIVGGFLGAGKTTVMLALSEYYKNKGIGCALISNDFISGELVDALYSEKLGADVSSMPGGCICYRMRELSEVLDKAFSGGADIVLSDIPGSSVGALDSVYRGHSWDGITLAPFLSVVDPQRLPLLYDDDTVMLTHLPADLRDLMRSEILEADAVVLNKTDTITDEQREEALSLIRSVSPASAVYCVSAKNGDGIVELAEYILSSETCLEQPEGLGADIPTVTSQLKLSRYVCCCYVKVCCDDFSPDDYIRGLMEQSRFTFASFNANMPHMKIFASSPDGNYCKYSLTGIDYPVEADRPYGGRATELSVVINAGFTSPANLVTDVMKICIDTAGKKNNLDTMIFATDCR